jgi:gliding motility-associated-like protein
VNVHIVLEINQCGNTVLKHGNFVRVIFVLITKPDFNTSSMQKNISSVIFIMLFSTQLIAQQKQTVTVNSWSEYDQKKLEGFIPEPSPTLRALSNAGIHEVWNYSTATPSAMGGGGGGTDVNLCDCYMPIDTSFDVVPFNNSVAPDYRNDDSSTDEIPLPFTFCLYGDQYTSVFINNNGNVSFGEPYGTFSANAFPDDQFTMVGAFWADVDTNSPESGLVYYKITDHALIVIWDSVGYFPALADKINSFQLIITDGSDPIIPDGGNVSFCYGDMQWTTGGASLGVGGFGGIAATVGANKGDGTLFIQFGQFDEPGSDYDGPFNTTDGISWLDNKHFEINTCQASDNIAPFAPSTGLCDTLIVCQGGSGFLQFLGPEQDQTVSIEYTVDVAGQLNVTSQPALGSTNVYINAEQNATPGVYLVTITGTDDGDPSMNTIINYWVEVVDNVLLPPSITGPEGVCPGQGGTLTVNPDYDTYVWSNGSSINTTLVADSGTYTVLVGLGICQTLAEYHLDAFPLPTPEITAEDLQVCPGQTTTLFLDQAYSSYEWDNNANNNQSTFEAGIGAHSIVVTNEFGCEGTDNIAISSFQIPTPQIQGTSPICDNATTALTTTVSYASYEWDNNPTATNATYTTGPGVHSVEIISDEGCVGTSSITINAYPHPQIFDDLICGEPLLHAFNDAVSPLNGTWSATTPLDYVATFEPANDINATMSVNGYGTYEVTFTDECDNQDVATIDYIPLIDFTLEPITICYGDSAEHVATAQYFQFYEWLWSTGSTAQSAMVYPDSTYSLTVSNVCGTLTKSLVVGGKFCTIEIPNIFTPNGDGNNDMFEVQGIIDFPGSSVAIYDRWGGLVYENANYKSTWGGDDVSDGTYYYIVGVKKPTGMEYYEGNVTIIR